MNAPSGITEILIGPLFLFFLIVITAAVTWWVGHAVVLVWYKPELMSAREKEITIRVKSKFLIHDTWLAGGFYYLVHVAVGATLESISFAPVERPYVAPTTGLIFAVIFAFSYNRSCKRVIAQATT